MLSFKEKMTMNGYVYLIGTFADDNVYKIGVTRKDNINERLKELQTGNSEELILVNKFKTNYPYLVENALHKALYEDNVKGEWFVMEDIKKFDELCEKYDNIYKELDKSENPFFKKMLKKH